MGYIDYETFNPKQSTTNSTTGDIIFVRTKNTQNGQSVTAFPYGKPYEYHSVFDETMKRSRKPRPGEKASRRFLINALDESGAQKILDVGVTVFAGIRDLFEALERRDIWVEITSTGTAMKTEYKVRKSKKTLPEKDSTTLEELDLSEVAATLVVDAPETAEPASTPPAKPMTKQDAADAGF